MNITEVRIKPMNVKNEKLKAFASITIDDDFVIRDLKVIEGGKGLFVAMPSRKLSDYCPKCRSKNHLRSKFCSECGSNLSKTSFGKGKIDDELSDGERGSLHADIAHPVNSACRDGIQKTVVKAFNLCAADSSNRGIFTSAEIDAAPEPEVFVETEKPKKAEKAQAEEKQDTGNTSQAAETPVEEKPVSEEVAKESAPAEEAVKEATPEPVAAGNIAEDDDEGPAPGNEAPKPPKKKRFGLGIFS